VLQIVSDCNVPGDCTAPGRRAVVLLNSRKESFAEKWNRSWNTIKFWYKASRIEVRYSSGGKELASGPLAQLAAFLRRAQLHEVS
jgi:hypothetical protein